MSSDAPTIAIHLAIGASGAFTDVSAYLESRDEEITYDWGQPGEFDPDQVGTFTFVLANGDGRFTPDNPQTPYDLDLTQGIECTWTTNSRVISGEVLSVEPDFPDDEPWWGRVTVTVQNVLGRLARDNARVAERIQQKASTLYWPLDDPDGATTFREICNPSGTPGALRIIGSTAAVRAAQATGAPFGASLSAEINGNADTSAGQAFLATALSFGNSGLPAAGWAFDLWVTPLTAVSSRPVVIEIRINNGTYDEVIQLKMGNPSASISDRLTLSGVNQDFAPATPLTPGAPSYVSFLIDDTGVEVSVNGGGGSLTFGYTLPSTSKITYMQLGSKTLAAAFSECRFRDSTATTSISPLPYLRGDSQSVADRLADLATTYEVTLAIEAGLTTDTVGPQEDDNALAAFQSALAVDAGMMWASDVGTATAPSPQINVRPRSVVRSQSTALEFDTELDLQGAPVLLVDLAERVSVVNASSPTTNLTVSNSRLKVLLGDASDDVAAPTYEAAVLKRLAEDRIRRGDHVGIKLLSFTIDARRAEGDLLDDLLSLGKGDLVRLNNLPTTQLGLSSIDGWVVGGSESHSIGEDLFTLHLASVLARFVYNTAVYAAGGALTLSSSVNAAATTLSVATTGLKFTTTNLPQPVQVGREVMTVTAATAGTPQSLTVVRGQQGTIARSHAAGSSLEVYPATVYSL
jgi:hypothetical protein